MEPEDGDMRLCIIIALAIFADSSDMIKSPGEVGVVGIMFLFLGVAFAVIQDVREVLRD